MKSSFNYIEKLGLIRIKKNLDKARRAKTKQGMTKEVGTQAISLKKYFIYKSLNAKNICMDDVEYSLIRKNGGRGGGGGGGGNLLYIDI